MPDDLNVIAERYGQLARDVAVLSKSLDLSRGMTEAPDWLAEKLDAITTAALELDEEVRDHIAAASGRRLRAARQAAEEAAERVRREEARRAPDLGVNRARAEARRERAARTRAELAGERSTMRGERRGILDRAKRETNG